MPFHTTVMSQWPSTSTVTINVAFIVSEDILTRLVTAIKELAGNDIKTFFRVGFADGSSVRYSDVDDLVKLSNLGTRTIRELHFSAVRPTAATESVRRTRLRALLRVLTNNPTNIKVNASEPLSISIVFDSARYGAPLARISVKGSERDVFDVGNAAREIVEMSRAWYSKLITIELFLVGMFLFVVGAFGVGSLLFRIAGIDGDIEYGVLEVLGGMAVIFGVPAVVLWVLNEAKKWLFPRAVFLIGEGKRRYDRTVFWRNTIGVVVLLGFLVSAAASFVVG